MLTYKNKKMNLPAYIAILTIIITLIIILFIIYKYNVEGEAIPPFKISKINVVSTAQTENLKAQEGTYIADTPGFSTFDISEIESSDLAHYFREFQKEIQNCEFVGCTHIKEENCGIKKAIKAGEISEERYERFCKIYKELKEKEERKKW